MEFWHWKTKVLTKLGLYSYWEVAKILKMLSQVNSLRNKPYVYKNVVFHYSKYWIFHTKKHMKIKVNHISRYPR